ncbi:MOSC N-terminal beta barrel domain-containing protein [Phormidium sp. CLA17]|uniref:MOSC domain-containing protein n=1 Tax=Leptolyngbya sp. Cla-17 TaxID=2803751 RepID=UPI001490A518|nr:MOSC N-terminal beta barrel domain-containing protein [Leptolyngbya sp. Cla-17]MBM0740068.1 MOSC N-terminal beta barrel domain-containing protein [Leptolyngbya sp. Cla-17]
MVHLAKILIYPIKSLDGVAVTKATLLTSGALKGDREFAIIDYQGQFVNGKRFPAIHKLRANFDLEQRTVSLQVQDASESLSFRLDGDRTPLESWLGRYFGFPVKLIQNPEMGFPDDTESPAPTIISTETVEAVAAWFPVSVENMRSRLRTTLEIAAEPFWEEQLFSTAGNLVPFHIGAVQFLGVNPCQRCIVPTRDPLTGEPYPDFQKMFVEHRKATFPTWAEASRFNHYYRLAVNTRTHPSEAGKTIQVGDLITL